MHSQGRIVAEVTDEVMDGDTPLEKKMNAFLTRSFILNRDVPADECMQEAKEIIEKLKNNASLSMIVVYLKNVFGYPKEELERFRST